MKPPALQSQILPADARAILLRAAMTPTTRDPLARVRALEVANAKVRAMYPQYFQKEEHDVLSIPVFTKSSK